MDDFPSNSIAKDYGAEWHGEVEAIDAPFIPPGNPILESVETPSRPQMHMVRLNDANYDDQAWPMDVLSQRIPVGAKMPAGIMDPMDDYRLVFDGSHA